MDRISVPPTHHPSMFLQVHNPLSCPWQPTVPASAYVDEDQGLYGVERKTAGYQHRQVTQGTERTQPQCLGTG